MNEQTMIEALAEGDWIGVRAMVPPKRSGTLLDAVFITDRGQIRLTGKAHSLRGEKGEAFSLAVFEHVQSGWWAESPGGKAKELSDEWPVDFWRSISIGPRKARFYSDPKLRNRSVPPQCLLDNCTAMELSGEARSSRIVVAASSDLPCNIEVGFSAEVCEALLAGMDQISLRAVSA